MWDIVHFLKFSFICFLVPSSTGNEAGVGAPRNRQIAHSVVLGTFNVGDQGEGIVPDLSRVYTLMFFFPLFPSIYLFFIIINVLIMDSHLI